RFFRVLEACGALAVVFPELAALRGKTHAPLHHPEGDAFEHALLALRQAADSTEDVMVRFAALTHDLGKGATPDEALPHHYGHEERGAEIVAGMCDRLRVPKRFARLAVQVAAGHMRCHRVVEMRPSKVMTLLETLDAMRQPVFFDRFLLACGADRKQRDMASGYPAGVLLRACLQAVLAVDSRPLVEAGWSGRKLGEALRQERIRRIKRVLLESDAAEQKKGLGGSRQFQGVVGWFAGAFFMG
ncbi:MAG: HD domain-containing protein, partial [Magnetococcales bacterium]|nr:HD domain-containing protein [Magnetococcales bacterium]